MEILLSQEEDMDEWWSEHERRRLTRLCAVLTGEPAAADDLAQETLLQAWRIRQRLVDPSGRGPWLDAIARHVCRRWRVGQSRLARREITCDRPADLPATPYAGYDEMAELLDHQELVDLLDRVLTLLPSETRQALVARYVDELGPQEIGRRLGLSPEAVSMRLTRGRARLRELLESHLADEPLAQAWVGRHGAAWRPTRLSCPTCGRRTTSIRHDRRIGEIQLRCDTCEPGGHPALELSLRDDASGEGVDMLVHVATMRPVAVVATR